MSGVAEPGKEISVRELRGTLADALNRAGTRGEIIYITNRGRRIAAIVPVPLAEKADAEHDS
jgi:prevent-host-death family protein